MRLPLGARTAKFAPMKLTRLLALTALALPVLAHAHPGHEGHELTWDFATGAAHPLSGWDHLAAMVAVGLWAAQLGGRNRWLVPAAFVGVMILGAALGTAGLSVPAVEHGIAASLLALGLFIAATVRVPTLAAMAAVGAFAFFHGAAHGAEMPASAGGLGYGIGFVAATILLHVTGLGVGLALKSQTIVTRWAGGAVALAGIIASAQ